MTKKPLSKHEVEQTKGAQRPPVVAPRGRSRLRERPGGSLRDVAPGRSSRASWLCSSGHVAPSWSDLMVSLWNVAVRSLLCLRAMKKRATSGCRSGQVALKGCHSDFVPSLR
ncbi:hypothetical protein F2Q69_00034579 [Brassica cretica]|uniref:Uncharacterized protein n=1 Tax=Brassica cretica TaxID=69181 RepID=A0A8S9SLY5_BRACR|nr:hypothetical protein F2Q69_00034579 [Brassica cretica]